MKNNVQFLFFILLSVLSTVVRGQDALPATEGNTTGTGGTVSYTIGQVVYTTNTGSSGSVSEGVQQPYEISVITGIESPIKLNLVCTAFPNPVTSQLLLKVEKMGEEILWYELYDIKGKLLESKKIEKGESAIPMDYRPSSTYLLKVVQTEPASPQQEIKTFKIVKK
jgi:hypothetical protein